MWRGEVVALGLLLWTLPSTASAATIVEAGGGGGYDSNLLRATSPEYVQAGGFASAWGTLGADVSLGPDDELFLDGLYDGSWVPDLPQLSVHRAGAHGGYSHYFGSRLSLRLSGLAGYRWFQEGARNGPDAGARLALRTHLWGPFSARGQLGYTRRWAEDPFYAYEVGFAQAQVELRATRSTRVSLHYTVQAGALGFESDPSGLGIRLTGPEVPLSGQDSLAHVFGADVLQSLGRHFYAVASWSYVRSAASFGLYQAQVFSAGAGAHF